MCDISRGVEGRKEKAQKDRVEARMVAVDKRRKQVAESDVELLMNIAGEEGTIPNQNEPKEIMSEGPYKSR